jgi:hypothetical protein
MSRRSWLPRALSKMLIVMVPGQTQPRPRITLSLHARKLQHRSKLQLHIHPERIAGWWGGVCSEEFRGSNILLVVRLGGEGGEYSQVQCCYYASAAVAALLTEQQCSARLITCLNYTKQYANDNQITLKNRSKAKLQGQHQDADCHGINTCVKDMFVCSGKIAAINICSGHHRDPGPLGGRRYYLLSWSVGGGWNTCALLCWHPIHCRIQGQWSMVGLL